MVRDVDTAINILITAQRKCEDICINTEEAKLSLLDTENAKQSAQ